MGLHGHVHCSWHTNNKRGLNWANDGRDDQTCKRDTWSVVCRAVPGLRENARADERLCQRWVGITVS